MRRGVYGTRSLAHRLSAHEKTQPFYAQSGGVTPVINASAAGVIQTARRHRDQIGKVLAGRNGILGALQEELIDTSRESSRAIEGLISTREARSARADTNSEISMTTAQSMSASSAYSVPTISVISSTTAAVIRRIRASKSLNSVNNWTTLFRPSMSQRPSTMTSADR